MCFKDATVAKGFFIYAANAVVTCSAKTRSRSGHAREPIKESIFSGRIARRTACT